MGASWVRRAISMGWVAEERGLGTSRTTSTSSMRTLIPRPARPRWSPSEAESMTREYPTTAAFKQALEQYMP